MNSERYKYNLLIVLTSIISSAVFVLLFSPYTSPLNAIYGIDSAIFDIIGLSINKGKLLYVDVFDHKGPMLFWVWALANQISGKNKIGIYILQTFSLSVACFYLINLCKAIKLKSSHIAVVVFAFFTLLCGVIYEGGLSEEWSLPCSIISLYWAFGYIKGYIKDSDLWKYGFLLGIFFAYTGWMRINNATVIAAVVFFVFLLLIKRKCYKNALICAGAFTLGAMVISAPILGYFASKNALNELIFGSFGFNIEYASAGFVGKTYKEILTMIGYVGVIVVLNCYCLLKKRGDAMLWGMLLFVSCVVAIACSLGYTFVHYYMVFLPVMITSFACFVKEIERQPVKKIVILLSILVLPYSYQIIRNAGKCVLFNFFDYYQVEYSNISQLGQIIPNDEKDSVWGIGITISKYYIINDLVPCIPVFDSPHNILSNDKMHDLVEERLRENRPKWIFKIIDEPWYITGLEDFVNSEYERVYAPELELKRGRYGSQKFGIELYRLKDDMK